MALLQPSILLFASIFLVYVWRFLFNNKNKTLKLPPSPPKLPIIGNLHQLGNAPHRSLHRLAKKLGPIMYLQLGEIPTVVLSSARMVKEVFGTHDVALSSRPQTYSVQHLAYNCTDIAFAPYGSYWRQMRKICILELLSTKRVQSYASARKEEVARLVQRISESCPSGTTNLSKTLGLYANDILCHVTFGKVFSETGDYNRHGFKDMLEEHQELLGGQSIVNFFPSVGLLCSLTGIKSRLEDAFRRFDRLLDEIIRYHLSSGNKKDHKDLVDVLLDIQQDADVKEPVTMENVKAIILDMFIAGTDTSFATLDWAMTELMMNPKAMNKAQAEVRTVVGDKRFVSETDLPQLHYLKAVLKEVFRLHPPAPVLVPRESTENITIEGYTIPAKTRFFINAWGIGRDPDTWENPNAFEPERFISSNIDFKGQDFELIPFGVGRRICPAIAFGIVTVELALAQLLYSFNWAFPPGVEANRLDMTETSGITIHRISPLIVTAKMHCPEARTQV